MLRRIDHYWRLFGTGFSFSLFGIGGLFLGLILFPCVHLLSSGRMVAERRCQYLVHLSFGRFIWLMKSLGVLSYETTGRDKLDQPGANLVIANHPSLIDIVFIISMLPECHCVVKKRAWSNPFIAGIMWATGYIPNNDPDLFIAKCVQVLRAGKRLVVFPEGTRTVPGQPMKLKRGAASIAVKSRQPFLPIVITCKPTALTKAGKWYQIPPTKPHFRLEIKDSVNLGTALIDGERLSKANRRVSRVFEEVLSNGPQTHLLGGRRSS
jgi:1-acyl-sn-glycerol-3-phosphate acyltransferase